MPLLSDRVVCHPQLNALSLNPPTPEDSSLFTPSIDAPNAHHFVDDHAPDSLLPHLEPDPSVLPAPQLASPSFESVPVLALDTIVGADVDPLSSRSLTSPVDLHVPRAPNLRLPSFELLGISNTCISSKIDPAQASALKHSSRLALTLDNASSLTDGNESDHIISAGPLAMANPFDDESSSRSSLGPLIAKNPARHHVTTLTPPDESRRILWHDIARSCGFDCVTLAASTDELPTTNSTESSTPSTATPVAASSQPRIRIHRTDSDRTASATWLNVASDMIIRNLESARDLHGFIRVLSHALPCPSRKGFAFPVVLNSLHDQTPGSPTCWINVFHALPGRFTLSDLPTSPPATPGSPVGGDDYFTSKFFDSAIPILDYQDNFSQTPKRAHPIVPPGTVHVSIVERYIPPGNANEFIEMFDVKGHSLLRDRLIELSPDNGTMLFIYPTKIGAETFLKDYLSPILDPLLRSMCVINNLSVDLGSTLGKMKAVSSMLSYEELESKLQVLCEQLSSPGSSLDLPQDQTPHYTLEYATHSTVQLDRSVWAQSWWIKQEKPRVRDIVSKYFRQARRLPVDSEIMPTSLIYEVLDGVASRADSDAPQPANEIEVAIFVIKRTA